MSDTVTFISAIVVTGTVSSIALPSGCAAGDTVFIVGNGDPTAAFALSGSNPVQAMTQYSTSGSARGLGILSYKLTSTDITNGSLPVNSGMRETTLVACRDANDTPIDAQSPMVVTRSIKPVVMTATGVDVHAGDLLLFVGAVGDLGGAATGAFTQQSGFTSAADKQLSNDALTVAYKAQTVDGATGDVTCTWNNNNYGQSGAVLLAIKPAASAGGNTSPISGNTSLVFDATASISANAALSGDASFAFDTAAILSASATVSGNASITFSATGALVAAGNTALSGSAPLTFSSFGLLSGGVPISGIAALAFSTNATLTSINVGDILFPDSLPAPSNFASVSFSPFIQNISVTSMDAGEPKRRKMFTYVPKTFTCSLRLTQAEVDILGDFYSNTCNSTMKFVWKDWLANTKANQYYAFLEEPTYVYVSDSKEYFDASMKLLMVKS